MDSYLIRFAFKTYEQAKPLLEKNRYTITRYHKDLDYILVKGDMSPAECFKDITKTPDPRCFVW